MLKILSSKPENSLGRLYTEEKNQPYRSLFQHDRDRIIHSTAFRKLKQKTQVFIENESDYYRTRLTHTLEVSQISRSLCRALSLNEDLSECISLAHDLGHPPFGHNGENALNNMMINSGGFNHNEQTLRILTKLEKKYPEFEGLNLCWESLEGIIKHNGKFSLSNIPLEIQSYNNKHDLNLQNNPTLEGQIASISDDIAYNNHDIDDAYRANLIQIDQLKKIKYFDDIIKSIYKKYPDIEEAILISELTRKSINLMVDDIIKETFNNISNYSIKTIKDVYNFPNFLVSMSKDMIKNSDEIRIFLYESVYNHKQLEVKRSESEAKIVRLFKYYNENFNKLPTDWINKANSIEKNKIICDYIAGMTDRYANLQYKTIYE